MPAGNPTVGEVWRHRSESITAVVVGVLSDRGLIIEGIDYRNRYARIRWDIDLFLASWELVFPLPVRVFHAGG